MVMLQGIFVKKNFFLQITIIFEHIFKITAHLNESCKASIIILLRVLAASVLERG